MKRLSSAVVALSVSTAPALAHVGAGEHGSFFSGFTHPLFGADHLLAMVTVGVWAALLGGRATLAVPAAFVIAMTAGFGAAMAGLSLPFVEPAILASVVALGLLAAIALAVPAPAAALLVAAFAVFHGFAHGSEIGGASVAAYAAGFTLATAALHVAGIGLSLGLVRLMGAGRGRLAARCAGGAVALAGVALALV